ncbi:eukaryotic cytochrome b561 domain-containing protein [Ditylenchus destructor]|nr:eukaryotic cytochrome b561 domain-containing protein [Ditylenchus destructor]
MFSMAALNGTSPGSGISSELKHLLIQIHGFLLIFGYFLCLSLGSASARYLRKFSPGQKIQGHRIWFILHRTINWMGMGLIAAGMLAILIAYNFEWKGPKPGGSKNTSSGAFHSLFGTISVVLAVGQPISLLFKCAPDDKRRRPWFNVIHRYIGIGSWITAAIALGIAAKNFRKRIYDTEAAFNICIIFLVSILILIAIGECIKKTIEKAAEQRKNKLANENQTRLFQIICAFSVFSAAICAYLTILIFRT